MSCMKFLLLLEVVIFILLQNLYISISLWCNLWWDIMTIKQNWNYLQNFFYLLLLSLFFVVLFGLLQNTKIIHRLSSPAIAVKTNCFSRLRDLVQYGKRLKISSFRIEPLIAGELLTKIGQKLLLTSVK